jgi:archaellum component FlaF (FlaF/FlaG flagellin family)
MGLALFPAAVILFVALLVTIGITVTVSKQLSHVYT